MKVNNLTAHEMAKALYRENLHLANSSLNKEIMAQFDKENIKYSGSKFSALLRFSKKYHTKKIVKGFIYNLLKMKAIKNRAALLDYWITVRKELILI